MANLIAELRKVAMGKRHAARRAALQYHFWRDLHGGDGPETIEEFWELCPAKTNVQQFAQPLIEGMLAHLPEIDERITRYCENYEFRRISAVDRNVLRLGDFRDVLPRRHSAGGLDQRSDRAGQGISEDQIPGAS